MSSVGSHSPCSENSIAMEGKKRIIVDYGDPVDMTKGIIKVIGVGGGGCSAVKNMYQDGIKDVTFAVCNTDSQSLS